ncbi:UDP-N-acetylmuramoyl-L-alanyl-D-glutamate--2,6-diaminopimelate ligase [Rhodococcus sp. NPDC058521]|uniref:UDP-N-acetylmuramoyl-L-alanyl-D-glutamate--2, 6-diaminopimelate ligase n=1 Tax=Rhodococcus sp. NPDC058521 TaxID=3346536 RepID=UPI0036658B96
MSERSQVPEPTRSQSSPSSVGAVTNLRPERPVNTAIVDLAALTGTRIEWVGAKPETGEGSVTVTGIDLRAQAILAGDLFAALPGARVHGARFVSEAVSQGARAVLTDDAGFELVKQTGVDVEVPFLLHENPRALLGAVSATIYGHPTEKMTVIGITGTSGKTTTSYLVEAAIAAGGHTPGLVGTIETRIKGNRVPSALTTPEAPQLHALFAVMLEQGIDTAVMEVSSHALALGRVDGVRFAIGAFTNLSQDHLDFHRDFEDYFAAKARLFDGDSPVRARKAVVCVDDEWGRRMAGIARDAGAEVVTVATTPVEPSQPAQPADWRAKGGSLDTTGMQSFDLVDPAGCSSVVKLRLPGDYNVANASLAVAVAEAAGVPEADAIGALASVDVPGRVQRVDRGQDFLAVVDYAHKPAALGAVIGTLRGQSSGRLAVVVGAGGDRDKAKRELMGAVSARGSELLIVTDDNPRTEDPVTIRDAVRGGAEDVPVEERGEIREVADRAAAIAAAVEWAHPGDVVLVAGKGHETGQEVDGVKHPFDDREVLADAIDRRIGGGK